MATAPMMREALVVVIAGEHRLLPMERVVQVCVHHGTTRIPGAPPWVRGLADLEGRPVEVFDAARRLGYGELQLDDRSCVIFCAGGAAAASAAGSESEYAGILVDAVQGIIEDEGSIPTIDLDAFFGAEVPS